MKEFDYHIYGGGCAGLSLAYHLEINGKLKNKTLAIIEPRAEYKRDKTWSFWKIYDHDFEDCVIKNWNSFSIRTNDNSNIVKTKNYPYQSIDSGKFYKKINDKLSANSNVKFFREKIKNTSSIVFNSVPYPSFDSFFNNNKSKLWQHFQGVEIETNEEIFDDSIMTLMDFNCEQKNSVHFFYILPFSKKKALIETTWISSLENKDLMDYDNQLKNYIYKNLSIKNYKVNYQEKGVIPLFYSSIPENDFCINIGSAGGMTRLSTGYTFLNIQEHSKFIIKNLKNLKKAKSYHIGKKYELLDNIFLKVLKSNPKIMPNIFYKMFNGHVDGAIKFLSNRSNLINDISVILKMPKWIFIKSLFN